MKKISLEVCVCTECVMMGSMEIIDAIEGLKSLETDLYQDLDIDVVFSGHDHIYARTYLLDGVDQIEEDADYTYNDDGIPVSPPPVPCVRLRFPVHLLL